MFNVEHFRRMRVCSGALALDFADTVRWFWSYYASRLPGARSAAEGCVQISVRSGGEKPLHLMIRKQGFDWETVEEIFVKKIYETKLDNVHRVLDLGGNIGLAALFFARNYPDAQICTVEPMPGNLAVLNRNVELNRAAIRVIPAAAGTEDGRARFVGSVDPRQHSLAAWEIQEMVSGETVEVDVRSVESLMQLMGWRELDLLKIDIEGEEVGVLGGRPAWMRNVRAIIGEGHVKANYTFEACRRDLEPMGFEVELLRQDEGTMQFLARRVG